MSAKTDSRLSNLLGAVAVGLADQLQSQIAAAADQQGSAPAALVALLDFTPRGSVHRLSQVVGLTHSGAVRLVDRLVGAELVRRGPGSDARSVTVSLTGRGRRVARRIRAERASVLEAALVGLTDSQRTELESACDVIVANLTAHRLSQRSQGAAPPGGALCRLCDFAACGRPTGNCPAARTVGSVAKTEVNQ